MFECLKNRRIFFDWRSNTIYEKVNGNRIAVDYDKLIYEAGYSIETISLKYSDWVNTVDILAYGYSVGLNRNAVDCPVVNKISNLDKFIGFGSSEDSRIELCAYMFVGIHYGFMKWEWENKFFYKLNNLVLWKKWFNKSEYN